MFPGSGPGSLKVSKQRNLVPYKPCFSKMGEAGNIAFCRNMHACLDAWGNGRKLFKETS